ncbi:MAG: hypothetical protein WCJ54_02280, partial [Actinomycetota bacterium]
ILYPEYRKCKISLSGQTKASTSMFSSLNLLVRKFNSFTKWFEISLLPPSHLDINGNAYQFTS